jgi:hypothetical protein
MATTATAPAYAPVESYVGESGLWSWLKNAPKMKPGSRMPTLGQGEQNPATKEVVKAPAGLTDQDIADLVAYLQALK